ncbi:MAG: OmpA family protein [Desulfobulbaceae bacterium]|nr:OmpA family protein [Desulfobulbaceae bacterium]HIJ79321.1 OmpA family protein [Deltaproteobacteria bacterium]
MEEPKATLTEQAKPLTEDQDDFKELYGKDIFDQEPEYHYEQPLPKQNNRWLITFADLMALLLCFFVLLFAMSQLDLAKFRQIAQSMSMALGGGKVIVLQPDSQHGGVIGERADADLSAKLRLTIQCAEQLHNALQLEIDQQRLDIEVSGQLIIIHILQHGSFEIGSATLNPNFLPSARIIRDALVDIPGAVTVAGYTDDLPVTGGKFRSNWELSGARAFSVMHELLRDNILPDDRFVLKGCGATHPRLPNTSEFNRAKNRRVEIIIDQRDISQPNKLAIIASQGK